MPFIKREIILDELFKRRSRPSLKGKNRSERVTLFLPLFPPPPHSCPRRSKRLCVLQPEENQFCQQLRDHGKDSEPQMRPQLQLAPGLQPWETLRRLLTHTNCKRIKVCCFKSVSLCQFVASEHPQNECPDHHTQELWAYRSLREKSICVDNMDKNPLMNLRHWGNWGQIQILNRRMLGETTGGEVALWSKVNKPGKDWERERDALRDDWFANCFIHGPRGTFGERSHTPWMYNPVSIWAAPGSTDGFNTRKPSSFWFRQPGKRNPGMWDSDDSLPHRIP